MSVAGDYQDIIFAGMARTLWLLAYSEWADRELEDDDDDDDEDEEDEVEEGFPPARPQPGGDWDDSAPETPIAALHAAHDLGELIASENHLASGRSDKHYPLTQLFYQAMSVHLGVTFPLHDEPWITQIEADPSDKELRAVYADWLEEQGRDMDAAYVRKAKGKVGGGFANYRNDAERFGSCLAFMATGTGVSWADDHVTKRDTTVFIPGMPFAFECNYDGEDLTWSGRSTGDADPTSSRPTRAHNQQRARYQGENEPVETERIGAGALSTAGEHEIILVNESDAYMKHSYVLNLAGTYLYIYAEGLDDAFDEAIDWIRDNEPSTLVTDQIDTEFNELKAVAERELGRELTWEEDNDALVALWEEADADTTTGGNYGDKIMSEDWSVIAEDPSETDLLRIAGLTKNPRKDKEVAGQLSKIAFGMAELVPNAKKAPESRVDKIATLMFRDTVTGRMLRDLAERGSMPQAEFMRTYMTRCERGPSEYALRWGKGKPSASAFLNNLGHLVIGSSWGTHSERSGPRFIRHGSEDFTSAAARKRGDTATSSRSMLYWEGPSIEDLIKQVSPEKREWAYQNLENQLLEPRATDNAEETARWIDRLRGPRQNPRLRVRRALQMRDSFSVDPNVIHRPRVGGFGKARR